MTPALVNTPVLETLRLMLRVPEVRDFDRYAGFYSGPRARFVGGPMPRDQAWRYFGHHVGHWSLRDFGSFAMQPKAGGAALGLILCHQPEGYPEREIGWSLFTDTAAGQGYAGEGARAVLDHVFGALGWKTAVSYIDSANARSIALAERLGAVHDPDAALPDEDPCIVYRHAPGGQR